MDGSYQAKFDKEEDEHYQNREEHLAFRKNFCDDRPPSSEDEDSQSYLEAEDEIAMMNEEFDQDNDESSGSTDLGNRGGTTFCF